MKIMLNRPLETLDVLGMKILLKRFFKTFFSCTQISNQPTRTKIFLVANNKIDLKEPTSLHLWS